MYIELSRCVVCIYKLSMIIKVARGIPWYTMVDVRWIFLDLIWLPSRYPCEMAKNGMLIIYYQPSTSPLAAIEGYHKSGLFNRGTLDKVSNFLCEQCRWYKLHCSSIVNKLMLAKWPCLRIWEISNDTAVDIDGIQDEANTILKNSWYSERTQPRPPHGPRILRASWMSLVIMVTRLACIAHRLLCHNWSALWKEWVTPPTHASSKRCTRYASVASCKARRAELCHRKSELFLKFVSVVISCVISLTLFARLSMWLCIMGRTRTIREKGSFRRRRSVLFWYFRISRSATVPGR